MSTKLFHKNITFTLLTLGASILLLTSCQKEEPKSPFDKMGESMSKAAKDMEKAAEEAAKEAEKAAQKAAEEAEKAAEEAAQAVEEATE